MGLALRARPEALADVPGTGDLPLTRAIIQYRASHEIEPRGGRIEDIGLALVLDGEYAASAEVLELGSAEVRHLDLSAELVIVDWVYEPTLDHVRTLLRSPRDVSLLSGEVVPGPLRQYCQAITLSVLRRAGFTALTRPTFLRIGFRDVVRDLDLNERTAARIVLRAGDVATFHFRYDDAVLCIERSRTEPDAEFERLLLEAFPAADSHRVPYPDRLGYDLRFPLPLSLRQVRTLMDQIREGLLRLYARYEPERYQVVRRALDVFGPADTLEQLGRWEPPMHAVPLRDLHRVAG
ncbi:MAG: hypothetical protein DIU52_003905 [bacterium]|jgi:hypothetical protein|nr:MAG: hypothetical protein DIU52_15610 [bacterium]